MAALWGLGLRLGSQPLVFDPVVMVARPRLPTGVTAVGSVEEAAEWVVGLG